MSRRLIDCFYPILLAISIAVMLPIPASAGDPILDRSMVPVTDFPLNGSLNRIGECCPIRWDVADLKLADLGASSCGHNVTGSGAVGVGLDGAGGSLGIHDSAPSYRMASRSRRHFTSANLKVATRRPAAPATAGQDISFPSAVMAVASVRVQQIVEPFAMVGPSLAPSQETLTEFLDWCNQFDESKLGSNQASIGAKFPVGQIVSIESMLNVMAAGALQNSNFNHVEIRNYVELVPSISHAEFVRTPSVSVKAINPLVGGSAIIASIGSGPYVGNVGAGSTGLGDCNNDGNNDGQLEIWSVFPTVTRPFCVRHSFDHLAIDHLGMVPTILIERVASDIVPMAKIGDAQWMLAEARSAAEQAHADAMIASLTSAVSTARQFGRWTVRQDESAKRVAIKNGSQLLSQTSAAMPTSIDGLRTLGQNVANWAFTGNQIASQAAVNLVKKMPTRTKPIVDQNAAAQLAAAAADSDRQ